MSLFSWTDGASDFAYSYDDTEPTIKDRIRGMIGDVNGHPVAYMSDNAISSVATECNNDENLTAAVCCERCASRLLSLQQEVKQGNRTQGLQVKNFDVAKGYQAFLALSAMYRNKSTPLSLPLVGASSVQIEPRVDRRFGTRRF